MNIDIKKAIKNYGGKWVVLNDSSSKIVLSGKNAKIVYEKAKKKGFKIPTLFKVPSEYIPYVG
ncbi:MAG: DUF5678 domain-containing protein [Patescibacteria group bacterium]